MGKYLVVVMAGLILFTVSGCASEQIPEDKIIFAEPSFINNIRGYVASAQIENRAYNFRYDNEEENIKFVEITENLINGISRFIDIPSTAMTILVAQDEGNYRLGHEFYITLDYQNTNLHGMLTNLLSKGQLPFWLSVGIELFSKYELRLFEPSDVTSFDDFSNMSFLPVLWEHKSTKIH